LKSDKKYTAFAKMFIAHFAPNILSTYIQIIDSMTAGHLMTPRITQQIAAYLEIWY
jgi:hypothetical protein